jgi:hypothetical protein
MGTTTSEFFISGSVFSFSASWRMGFKPLWLALFVRFAAPQISSCHFVSRISAPRDLAEDGPLMTWRMGSLGDLKVSKGERALKNSRKKYLCLSIYRD